MKKSPINKVRRTLRKGEPTPIEKQLARVHACQRADGRCEMQLSPECTGERVLPLEGDLFERGHLHHALGKRRFGWMESRETGQYHVWACAFCHVYEHNGGKPVPSKDAA